VSASDRARFEATAAMLQPHLSPGDSILDIGCATGALLAELRERGLAQVTGLDPSPVCAASARRVYDIPVLVGTLAEVAVEEPFDLVILVGVLEHVRDLAPMLAQVGPLLRPGGLAFVEVPDALQFTDWRNAPFQQFSVEHINFFSPTNLENAMNCNGFDTVAVYQDVREVGHRAKDPVASGVFRRREHQEAGGWRKDPTTAPALRSYIEQCRGSEAQERRKIDELVASGEPLIVWGTGTQTQRLLATGNLGKTNLRAFVDSNVKYQGKTLHDLPILGPEELKGRSETVLISSWMYQEEIHQQLRDTLGLPNKVVLIYAR
jgi:SAM-dependent methyltransferase